MAETYSLPSFAFRSVMSVTHFSRVMMDSRLTFEIEKGQLSFRLTAPYSEERRNKARAWAKVRGIQAGK